MQTRSERSNSADSAGMRSHERIHHRAGRTRAGTRRAHRTSRRKDLRGNRLGCRYIAGRTPRRTRLDRGASTWTRTRRNRRRHPQHSPRSTALRHHPAPAVRARISCCPNRSQTSTLANTSTLRDSPGSKDRSRNLRSTPHTDLRHRYLSLMLTTYLHHHCFPLSYRSVECSRST